MLAALTEYGACNYVITCSYVIGNTECGCFTDNTATNWARLYQSTTIVVSYAGFGLPSTARYSFIHSVFCL